MACRFSFAVVALLLCASPVLSIRVLQDADSMPKNQGRQLNVFFGGLLLRGVSDFFAQPFQGGLLAALAEAMRRGSQENISVDNGTLNVMQEDGTVMQQQIQIDPVTGQSFVIDQATGATVFVDPVTGVPLADQGAFAAPPAAAAVPPQGGIQFDQFGNAFVIDPNTGNQIFVDPNTGFPLPPNGGGFAPPVAPAAAPLNPPQIQFDSFGQAFIIDPFTGQQVFVDPNTGVPLQQNFQGGVQG